MKMKKLTLVSSVMFFASCLVLFGQSDEFRRYTTDRYEVLYRFDGNLAQEIAEKLEKLIVIYNDYFRFDLDALPDKLTVRLFSSKSEYDSYLRDITDRIRNDFTYLQFSDPQRSELLVYPKIDIDRSLVHQGFVQYLHTFVAEPPFWLREGFATYIEGYRYDDAFDTYVYRENLIWLEQLQSILRGEYSAPMRLREILGLDLEAARYRIDVFYPQSWGMVAFLVNSQDKMLNRLLWDTMSALDREGSLAENIVNVERRAFRWIDERSFMRDFEEYVLSRNTFRQYVEAGVEQYLDGMTEMAVASFSQALQIRDDSFIPYYYLGLINYDLEQYELAEYHYNEALTRGSLRALTYYALGVNAYSDMQFEDAERYLERALALDRSYSDDATRLLESIGAPVN